MSNICPHLTNNNDDGREEHDIDVVIAEDTCILAAIQSIMLSVCGRMGVVPQSEAEM